MIKKIFSKEVLSYSFLNAIWIGFLLQFYMIFQWVKPVILFIKASPFDDGWLPSIAMFLVLIVMTIEFLILVVCAGFLLLYYQKYQKKLKGKKK